MFGPVFAQCALTWDAYAGIHLSAEAGQQVTASTHAPASLSASGGAPRLRTYEGAGVATNHGTVGCR